MSRAPGCTQLSSCSAQTVLLPPWPPQSKLPKWLQWEDVAFKKGDEQHGGKWTCIVRDRKLLDEFWLNTILALIG